MATKSEVVAGNLLMGDGRYDHQYVHLLPRFPCGTSHPKKSLSQYGFRHSLSLAWMKTEKDWKTQRYGKRNLDFATEESRKGQNRAYTRSVNIPVRSPSLYNSSLDVTTGKLKCRANIHSLSHFPAMLTIWGPTCACHR